MNSESTQISIGRYVPVMPTDESQADKGINHPIVSCWDCDTEWRSYTPSRCPGCACYCGVPRVLSEKEMEELMEAISYLDETKTFDYNTECDTWEFHTLLEKYASCWYDMSCRVIVQACYLALLQQDPHPNIAFALAFFQEEYALASESETMYDPNDESKKVPSFIAAWCEYLDQQE